VRSRRLLMLAVISVIALALPVNAASSDSLPEGAIPLAGGGYALELSAPTPAWYTPELHQRILDAGAAGVPIPSDADIPASGLAFTGIRPGAWMFFPAWCTMNFVFGGATAAPATEAGASALDLAPKNDKEPGGGKGQGGGSGGTKGPKADSGSGGGAGSGWYIGTAGHCTEVGDEVTLIAAPGLLMNIGRTVKSYNDEIGRDFALIEIYPEMVQYVNPSMTYWGGPTATAQPAIGDPVVHAGHGAVVGTGGTPRAGIVTYVGDGDQSSGETAYGWDGVASLGDSGSGVRHASGPAVGNLTHLVVGTEYVPAFIAGTTAPYMEQLAGAPICYAPLTPNPLPAPACAS